MPDRSIEDVPDNDIPAAVAYAEQCVRNGTWTQDRVHAVLHMQDDPDDLIAALKAAGVPSPTTRSIRVPRAVSASVARTDSSGNPYHGGDGKFASGPGAVHHERATASLNDPHFRAAHAGRLEAADREARAESSHSPESHRAAIHAEAMRIHAEHDAIGGDPRRAEIAETARVRAHYDKQGLAGQHEHALAALAEDHAAGLEEHRAELAGHLKKDVPHEKHDAFLSTRDRLQKQLADVHESLDRAHGDAAESLGRLHAVSAVGNDHHPGWEHKLENIGDLPDDYGATSATFEEVTGGHAREFGNSTHEIRPFPQREEFHAQHEYESAVAAHENAFKQRAWLAQSALERLHEQQKAAAKTLKDVDRQHEKARTASIREAAQLDVHDLVNEKAFAHYERDHDGDIKDAIGAAHLDRARAASERRVSVVQNDRENAGLHDLEDARTQLHDETQSTRSAIRDLAKITGRTPKLAGAARSP